MTNQPEKIKKKPSRSTYQITVKGALTENWRDWFNGMLVSYECDSECSSQTTLTCNIRDQSELVGIINWLHNMNLTLLQLNCIQ